MSTTKKCPFCAEEILSEAIKCKHCKSELFGIGEAYRKSAGLTARDTGIALALVAVTMFISISKVHRQRETAQKQGIAYAPK